MTHSTATVWLRRANLGAAGLVATLGTAAVAAAAVMLGLPTSTVVALAVGLVALVSAARALVNRPWLTPWLTVPVFAGSAEAQLRIGSSAGVLKDLVVVGVLALCAVHVRRDRALLTNLRRWRTPLLALAVLVGLYLADPAGTHGLDWALSCRLVLETSGLLVAGLLSPHPGRTVQHLIRAVASVAVFEAAFAWIQHLIGENTLVYSWGYQFGAQVRLTSSGGLRTSGTFADPFQLAALGLLALCLGLFLAKGRTAAVLVASALAITAATSVRTLFLQLALVTVLWALSRNWRVQAAVAVIAATAAGLLAGLLITTAAYPGAAQTPLLFGLNGRSTAWSLAVRGVGSFFEGNGVAAIGSGSTRAAQGLITAAPTYNSHASPVAVFAGNSAFLDSTYAQIQSDVGILGIVALLLWLAGLIRVLYPATLRAPAGRANAASYAALALLLASAVDWVGRTTLFSFPTGFIALYVLGLLCASASKDSRAAAPAVRWGRSDKVRRTPARPGRPTAQPSVPVDVDLETTGGARLARLGVAAAVASRVFGRLVGVLFVVVLAHTSSNTTVAVYGYLLGTATLMVTLTDLGVAAIAGREVAAGRLPAQGALAAALPAQAVSVLAACALTIGLIDLSGPVGLTTTPIVMTMAFLVLNGMVNLWGELLRGQGRVLVEASLQMLSATMFVLGGFIVVAHGGGAGALLAVVAGKEVVILLLSWLLLRPRRRAEVVRTRQLVRHSAHLAVAGTAVIILWRQGTIFVGATGSVAALAVYVVASRFLDAGVTLANTVGFGLMPGASAIADDPVAFGSLARKYLRIVGAFGLATAIIGAIFARPLTLTLFGSRWGEAVPAVRAIALAALPIFLGYVAWFLLLAAREQRWLAGTSIASSLVAVGVSAAWSQLGDGPLAAAAGTAVGAAVLASALVGRLLVVLRSGRPAMSQPSTRLPEPAGIA